MLIGKAFILLITNDIDKNPIIKNDRRTIPKALKLDFKLRICFVEIIKDAKIQNWVKKIIGITKSGVIAKNLNNPGACAKPTAVKNQRFLVTASCSIKTAATAVKMGLVNMKVTAWTKLDQVMTWKVA